MAQSVSDAAARLKTLEDSWGSIAAKDVNWLSDFNQCKRMIVALVRSARTSIHYSTFLCDVNFSLALDGSPSPTFAELLRDAVARGVQVKICYNPESCYGNASEADFVRDLAGCEIRSVRSSLAPAPWMMYFSNNTKFGYHHQKYMCIDGKRLMVTGCDINGERAGWLQLNQIGYYWHELSVVVPCTPAMLGFFNANFASMTEPVAPLLNSTAEHGAMVDMILSARHSVQLENQSFMSGPGSAIKIAEAFAERIARARQEGDTQFRAMIFTNMAQQDEPSFVTRLYCSVSLLWSVRHIERTAAALGVDLADLYEHLFFGYMESDGVLVKVHSNILIVDGRLAIRSSSNLSDRSLSHLPTDSELGVFVTKNVDSFQQTLFNNYMRTRDVRYSFNEIFDVALRGGGVFRSVHPRLPRYPDALVNATMRFLQITPATGGQVESVFTSVPGGTPVPSLHPKDLPVAFLLALVVALGLVAWFASAVFAARRATA